MIIGIAAVIAAVLRTLAEQPWRVALLLVSAVFAVWFVCGSSRLKKDK